MFFLEGTLKGHLVHPCHPCHQKQRLSLDQVAQSLVQPDFKHFQ